MKNHALVAVVVTVVIVGSAEARTQEIRAWRGETVAANVEDFVELGSAPDGLAMRVGVLRPVRYAPMPRSHQRLECLDRVEWNSAASGPRVVEVGSAGSRL